MRHDTILPALLRVGKTPPSSLTPTSSTRLLNQNAAIELTQALALRQQLFGEPSPPLSAINTGPGSVSILLYGP